MAMQIEYSKQELNNANINIQKCKSYELSKTNGQKNYQKPIYHKSSK